MARVYLYDCEKCGYRSQVVGGAAEGFDLSVQTIHCTDCHSLHDAVLALKVPVNADPLLRPPQVEEVMNQLRSIDRGPLRWEHFALACPVSPDHKVEEWRYPGKCPLCSFFLEPSALPFREWD